MSISINRGGDVSVEVRLPALPEGLEYTGEFRLPNKEEYFLDLRRGCCRICIPEESRPQVGDFRFIIRKVATWRPAVISDLNPDVRVKCRVRDYDNQPWKTADLLGILELHGTHPVPVYPFTVRLEGSTGYSYFIQCEVQDNAPEDQPQQSVNVAAEESKVKSLLCIIELPFDGSKPPIFAETKASA